MNSLLTEECSIDVVKLAVADGTAEVLTDVIDMQGYDELTYVVIHGDVDAAAVMTYQPKENTANSTSSPTPTAVSLASGTDSGSVDAVLTTGAAVITESSGNLDNKAIVINIAKNKLGARYHFLSITCTVESHEIVAIIAIRSKARSVPVTQGTDVVCTVKAAA